MNEEDMSIMIWLPTQPDELDFLETTLREASVLVPGNYDGNNNPYVLTNYLAAAAVDDCEFRALFDRNIISPLVALARGESVPDSSQAQATARLAAACACFCIMAGILIEPNISLYEFAATSGNSAAQSDAYIFRVADNLDAMAFLDIAMGRASQLPRDMLERVKSLPEVAGHIVSEKDFERQLSMWRPNYLYALKTVALRRAGLGPLDSALALTRWQTEEAFFSAPAGMYCIAAISHTPPKGGMLKGILSENIESLRSGLRNATWDMCLLRQFGRLASKPGGPRWSLWSTDVALRQIARSLFVRGDSSEQAQLCEFYKRHWGTSDGRRLAAAYEDAYTEAHRNIETRRRMTGEFMNNIDEHIYKLEHELGLSDA